MYRVAVVGALGVLGLPAGGADIEPLEIGPAQEQQGEVGLPVGEPVSARLTDMRSRLYIPIHGGPRTICLSHGRRNRSGHPIHRKTRGLHPLSSGMPAPRETGLGLAQDARADQFNCGEPGAGIGWPGGVGSW